MAEKSPERAQRHLTAVAVECETGEDAGQADGHRQCRDHPRRGHRPVLQDSYRGVDEERLQVAEQRLARDPRTQEPAAERERGQDRHRQTHHGGRLVGVPGIRRGAGEGQHHRPRHIHSGDKRGRETRDPHQHRAAALRPFEGSLENQVLTEEARKRRHTGQRQPAHCEPSRSPAHRAGQPAESAHVDDPAHGMHHTARGQEEQRFEERMRREVEHAGGHHHDAHGQEHVAQLADGRIGEDPLKVPFNQGHGGGEERRHRTDGRHHGQGVSGVEKQGMQPRDHVHACGDHRRGVDKGRDRRRAFHRVGQPDVQRQLRRLSGGAGKEQQRGRGQQPRRHSA